VGGWVVVIRYFDRKEVIFIGLLVVVTSC
jgi:hypothetical protein